jgi:predicted RNA binding protein YcfA (HicA-like mRNA interferase family)
MVATAKLIEKLSNQTIKKQELATLLQRLGFVSMHGRGSHEVWGSKAYSDIHIVVATHSKDVPIYQLRQIEKSLKKRGLV